MKEKYYNGGDLLNANCPINFSIGNRSTGKSYYWKRYCIRRFLKYGEQFIYIRRHQVDIDISIKKFFSDISNEFRDYKFEASGGEFTIIDCTGSEPVEMVCGYYFPLSGLHKIKSIPFEEVETILFDEFIPENLQYLKPLDPAYESNLLLSLYLTVARGYNQVIRDSVKIICIANLITMYNPYFTFFNIDLTNKKKEIVNNVYAEIVTNDAVAKEIRESKIGAILECTEYGEYALNNVALKDDATHIVKHPNGSIAFFEIYCYEWYICYLDLDGRCYFDKGYDETMKKKYKVVKCKDNEEIPWFKGDIVKTMKKLSENDMIYYGSMKIKATLAGLFNVKVG